MKKYHAWGVYLCLGCIVNAAEQNPAPNVSPTVTVSERSSHSRLLKHVSAQTLPDGRTIQRTNAVTELATGLHYFDQGQWQEARDEIEIVADGAAASKAQHKVHFSGNINSQGAVKITTPDSLLLKTHILGLAYTDTSSGQSVLIGQIRDTIGELFPPNQVVYADSFTGVFADVRYTFTKVDIEQDIILRTRLPAPSRYEMNAETTLVEIWTEFIDAPEPISQVRSIGRLHDEILQFGSMRMGRGAAFTLDAPINRVSGVPVGKRWFVEPGTGRTFLIESVRYPLIAAELAELPPERAALPSRKNTREELMASLSIPKAERRQPIKKSLNRQAFNTAKGFVIDYTLQTGYKTNFTFQTDTTYFISGTVNLYGTTTFEGGTVLKYSVTNVYPIVQTWEDVIFKTEQYRPAIFTSQQDRTVGVDLWASGFGTNYFQALALTQTNIECKHLRISYADTGLHGFRFKLKHAQFTHCGAALEIDWGHAEVDNVLFYDNSTAFYGIDFSAAARHVTVSQGSAIAGDIDDPSLSDVAFTNSLLINTPTNYGGVNITTNHTVITAGSVFQTVGAGAHYLADTSPYRDAGTTTIPATLASELKRTTTYPPVTFAPSGVPYGSSQTLSPTAPRDTDLPDLGYHYDPIDYAVSGVFLTNATIQVDPGTVMAAFGTNSSPYAFLLADGAALYAEGRADAKVHLTRYSTVQEMANTNWAWAFSTLAYNLSAVTNAADLRCRFTDFSTMQDSTYLLSADSVSVPGKWEFRDVQFHGAQIYDWTGPAVLFTNCLFNRVYTSIGIDDSSANRFHNCTFHGGTWETYWGAGNTISFTDNLFAGTYIDDWAGIASSHIGYTTNCVNRLQTTNANDTVLTSLTFQTGTLGHFYIPTNCALLNAGSMNATNATLYHYTMVTNNVKETNSMVDIGFHYVATDANGAPLDYDNDGVPDYWEDRNGNGSHDAGAGETDWQAYNSTNGLSGSPSLKVFTPLR